VEVEAVEAGRAGAALGEAAAVLGRRVGLGLINPHRTP